MFYTAAAKLLVVLVLANKNLIQIGVDKVKSHLSCSVSIYTLTFQGHCSAYRSMGNCLGTKHNSLASVSTKCQKILLENLRHQDVPMLVCLEMGRGAAG